MLQQKQIALSSESAIDINERCISLQPGFSQEILTEIIPKILKESGIVFISANSSLQNGILTSLSSTLSASPIATHFFIETNEPQTSPFIHAIQATKKATHVLKGKALLESLKNKTTTHQEPATEQDWINGLNPCINKANQQQLIVISTPALIESLAPKVQNLTQTLTAPLSQMIDYTNGRSRPFFELESTISISDPEDPNLRHNATTWKEPNEKATLSLSSFDVSTREFIQKKPQGLDINYDDISAISGTFNTITLYGNFERAPLIYDDITLQFVNDTNPIIPIPVTDNELDLNSICLLSDKPHYVFRSIQATVSNLFGTYDEVIIHASPSTKSLLFDTMILWDGQFNGIFLENGYRSNENHSPSRVTIFHDPFLWSLEPKMNAWKKESNPEKKRIIIVSDSTNLEPLKTLRNEHVK